MNIASFDIFDTCLIRKCGKPENLFFLLSKKIFPQDTAKQECFLHWRLCAEGILEKKNKQSWVTLDDIYQSLDLERFDLASSINLIEEEKNLEREMLVCNPKILELINEKRQQGYNIAFISDMYLDTVFLIDMLQEAKCWEKDDRLFVSCESKATKREGTLFEIVRNELHPTIWHHFGDNYHSDYIQAKNHGACAHIIDSCFNKAEQFMLKNIDSHKHKYPLSCIIGLLRYSRLCNCCADSSVSSISANFVAPIYTSYILDVLNKCVSDGISRLYFLSRDGWILKEIASLMSDNYPEIDLRYIFVSRKSLYLPSLEDLNIDELKRYWGGDFFHASFSQLIKYFKIDIAVEKKEIPKVENDNLADASTENALKSFINNPKVYKNVMQLSNKEHKLITSYFKQEGLFEDIPYAFVDIGWKGSGLYAINKLLNRKTRCFYWGTFKEYRNKYSCVFNTYNHNQLLPIYLISFMEDFFSASPQLSTIGYEGTGIIKPVFDKNSRLNNNLVVGANISALQLFVKGLKDMQLLESHFLDVISMLSLSVLTDKIHYMDLTSLNRMKCFSEKGSVDGLVHKLTVCQTVRYAFGLSINEIWPEGCLYFSYPNTASLFGLTNRLTKTIYKKIKRMIHG